MLVPLFLDRAINFFWKDDDLDENSYKFKDLRYSFEFRGPLVQHRIGAY